MLNSWAVMPFGQDPLLQSDDERMCSKSRVYSFPKLHANVSKVEFQFF